MSNRKSASVLLSEYLYRIICLRRSPEYINPSRGIVVNHEGGISRKHPALQRLITMGLVKIIRSNGGRTARFRPARLGFWQGNRHYTWAVPTKEPMVPVDKTCPACGRLFAKRTRDRWIMSSSEASKHHAYDCPIRDDHSLDSYSRKNEIRESIKRPSNRTKASKSH